MDGTDSRDSDDVIVSYLWEQIDGPEVNLTGADTLQASFTAPDVGPSGASLTLQFTVTDSGGLQDNDTCTVNINGGNDSPTNSKNGGGGGGALSCFIATAVSGSPIDP